MRRALAIALAALACACGNEQAPPPPAAPAPEAAPTAGGASGERLADDLRGEDIELRLFRKDGVAGGGPEKPTFEVRAPVFRIPEPDVFILEGARATIFGSAGEETRIDAAHGVFNRKEETAVLGEGVSVDMGRMQVQLDELRWNNAENAAVSEGPLTLVQGGTRLEANGMMFLPDEQRLTLKDVSGTYSFDSAPAAPSDDVDSEADTSESSGKTQGAVP